MRRLFIFFLVLTTIFTLVAGKLHWDEKIGKVQVQAAEQSREKDQGEDVEADKAISEPDSAEKKAEEEEEAENEESVLNNTNNLPEKVRVKFREAIATGKPIKLLILGSAATSEKEDAWPALLEKKLKEAYGEFLQVNTREIPGKTSKEIIQEKLIDSLAKTKPDILLIEPFLLHDNGKVDMLKRLENLSKMIDLFKSANPDISVIIQPANPIEDAHYYVKEEYDLERYAKRNQFTYLNHWDGWPEQGSEKLRDYLTKDSLPNEKGNKVWAEYLVEYFVSKK